MISEIHDAPALRMPPACGPQAANSRQIHVIGNSPELHLAGSGKDSMIDLLEQLADDSRAEFVLQQVGWFLA